MSDSLIDKKGISLLSVIPMRKEPNESSEMVSQVIFGETYIIKDEESKWIYIMMEHDGYKGWIDKLMFVSIQGYESNDSKLCTKLWNIIDDGKTQIILPLGSQIRLNAHEKVQIGTLEYTLKDVGFELRLSAYEIGLKYLRTPYLWGGRTPMGIDCSGFTQTIFKICGLQIPRDAYQQERYGEYVNSLEEAQKNDVAFFSNDEGRVIHVGILKDSNTIIHSSGWVKESPIDTYGIKKDDGDGYSHRLTSIKRILF